MTAVGQLGGNGTQSLADARGVDTFEAGGRAYAAVASAGDNALRLVDISDPSAPAIVGSIQDADADGLLLNKPYDVDIFEAGGRAYAAVASRDHGLQLVDVTNPASPVAAGQLPDDGSLLLANVRDVDVFTMGDSAYAAMISRTENKLQLVDVTNPASPVAAGSLTSGGITHMTPFGMDIFEAGGRAYAAVAYRGDNALRLVDVTDPSSPARAGDLENTSGLLLQNPRGVDTFVMGEKTYAAVASGGEVGGLQLVDVTDPRNPRPAGHLADSDDLLLGAAWYVDTFKMGAYTYAAVASDDGEVGGLQLVDVTDPRNPRPAGQLADSDDLLLENARDVAVFRTGDSAYAAVTSLDDDGLQLIRLSPTDTTRPAVIHAALNERTGVLTVTFDEPVDVSETDLSRLYVSDDGATNQIGLADAAFDYAAADSDTVSVTLDDDQRLNVIRLRSPQLDIAAGAVYDLAGNAAAAAVDVPIPVQLDLVVTGQLEVTERPLDDLRGVDTFRIGNDTYAAVVSHKGGSLHIVDITRPDLPLAAGSLDSDNPEASLLADAFAVDTFETDTGTYAAVVSTENGGLTLINITDPDNLIPVGDLPDTPDLLLGKAFGVDTFRIGTDTYAAVASAENGLQLVDITDPESPAGVGQLPDTDDLLLNFARDVDVFKTPDGRTYAAVASNRNDGLQLVDVSIPSSPKGVGKLPDTDDLLLKQAWYVETFKTGGKTYAAVLTPGASGDDGLQLVDVTDPKDPKAVGHLADSDAVPLGYPYAVDIFTIGTDTYAAVASADDGLQLVDITNPESPEFVRTLVLGDEPLVQFATGVDFVEIGGTEYVAVAHQTGFQLVRVDATRPALESATLSEHTGVLTLHFDQVVDASETDLSRLYIRDGAGDRFRIPLTGASIGRAAADSDTVSVTLTSLQRLHVIRLDTPQLDIAAGAVYDPAGNAMDPVADVPVTIILSPDVSSTLTDDDPSRLLTGALDVDIFKMGDRTYAAVASSGDDGLQLVDITNTTSPAIAGSVPDTVGPRGLLLDGASGVDTFKIGNKTYAAVASRFDDGLQLVDITNQTSPVAVGNLRNADGLLLDGASGVDTFKMGNKIYAAVTSRFDDGLQLVDVSNPSTPAAAGKLADNDHLLLKNPRDVDVFTIGTTTYAVVASVRDDGLQLVDVSNPSTPAAAGSISDTEGGDLLLDGASGVDTFKIDNKTYAAVASRFDDGLQLVDVSDPASPSPAGSISDTEGGDLLLDLPLGVDTFKLGESTYAAVTSHRDDGLQIIDISDPGEPMPASNLPDDTDRLLKNPRGVDVFTIGTATYAAVASAGDDGLQLVLIDGSGAAFPAGRLADDLHLSLEAAHAVDTFLISGRNYAIVVSDLHSGLQIIDVTDPSNLVRAGSLVDDDSTLIHSPRDVDVFTIGNRTYAAVVSSDSPYGLSIVDVTNPDSPYETDNFEDVTETAPGEGRIFLTDARDVAVFETPDGGTYAAVTSYKEDGIQIIDISNPSNLVEAGHLGEFSDPREPLLALPFGIDTFETGNGTYAAVGTLADGLMVVDVTDPDNPRRAGHLADDRFLLLDGARDVDVFAIGGRTYAAVASLEGAGLQLVDVTNPSRPTAAGQVRYSAEIDTLVLLDHRDLDIFTADGRTYAAVASGSEHLLLLVDITDPANPFETLQLADGTDLLLGNPFGVAVFETDDGNTYAAVTSSDESSLQVIRLTTEATAKPVITVLGDNPATHELGFTYVDAGAEAIYADPPGEVMTTIGVDTDESGTYRVLYTATDASSSTATATRTVHVRDTTKPVITPNGTGPFDTALGAAYEDPGATVTDNDPDYDGTATPSDTVDINMAGNYAVTYTAPADDGGNVPDPVSRTVTVRDTPPTAGPGTMQVAAGQSADYSPVARGDASDLQTPGKDLLISIADTNPTEKGTAEMLGNQTIRYTANPDADGTDGFDYVVTDAAGLTATATVTVTITDNPAPRPDGQLAFTVREGQLLNSTIAITDDTPGDGLSFELDGSEPDNLIVTSKAGSDTDALITWQAPDEVDAVQYSFGLSISDGVNDAVTGTVTITIMEVNQDPAFDAVAHARTMPLEDVLELPLRATDADLPAQILTYGITGHPTPPASIDPGNVLTWSPAALGSQTITVRVVDDFDPPGSDSAEISVEVVDVLKPVIALNGAQSVTVELDGAYTELGANVTDNDPDYAGEATPEGAVDTGSTGVYTVTYTAPADDGGNAPDAVTRTVTVQDTTAPAIILNGANPLRHELGDDPYEDPGATADDGSEVVANATAVDVYQMGDYTVTYTATDSDGNTGMAARTVQVRDGTKPVIALNGAQSVTVELDGAYTELGANVTDNDPDYAGEATPEGAVDTGSTGVYTVTYTAPADDGGNAPDAVTRTVTVQDAGTPDPPKPRPDPAPEPGPRGPSGGSGGSGMSDHNRDVNRDPVVYIRSVAWDCAAGTVTIAASPASGEMTATVFTLLRPQYQTESWVKVGDAAVFSAHMHPEETYMAVQVSSEIGGHVGTAAELIDVDSCAGGRAFAGDDIILLLEAPDPGALQPADPAATEPPSNPQVPQNEAVQEPEADAPEPEVATPEPDADAAGPEAAGSRAEATEPPSSPPAPPDAAVREPEAAGSQAAEQTEPENAVPCGEEGTLLADYMCGSGDGRQAAEPAEPENAVPCGEEGTLLADYMCGTEGGSDGRIGARGEPAEPAPGRCDLWCWLSSMFAWL